MWFSKSTFCCTCFLLVLLAALLVPAFGSFQPSFGLDYCSWNATHIVLAEVTPQDGEFKVIESWKGNLNAGDHVSVPHLEPGPHAIPIASYLNQSRPFQPSGKGNIEDIPRQPVGSHLILFTRHESEDERPPNSANTTGKPPKWEPSDFFREIRSSVIWLDGSELYVFMQWTNPGPSVLLKWDKSLAAVHARVAEIIQMQKDLNDSVRLQDKGERAERLKPYVHSDAFPAREFALEQLGKCGPPALATIRTMLDNPEYALEAEDLIKAYSEAGGESAGEELSNRLEKELAFWQATGPKLEHGWWNEDAKPDAPLRLRYGQTIQLIRGLQRTHYVPSLTTAIQLRDFWRSLPQLNDPSGLNQLATECDSLIKHLQQGKQTTGVRKLLLALGKSRYRTTAFRQTTSPVTALIRL
jgi:hypothetical protein